jgi:hypothetical protein
MRLTYIDEAGISNPTQEPWVVVAGVIVDADRQLVHLERKLDKLIGRYIPPPQQNDFVFQDQDGSSGI